jgi:hypothetical protein
MEDLSDAERPLMLPMAEILWFCPVEYYEEGWPVPSPIPWTIPWCREQQKRALEHGHAFYEGRYDYDGTAAPVLAVGVEPTCPGCGAALPVPEAMDPFAWTAFAAAEQARGLRYTLTFDWYPEPCACGVSSEWKLSWGNHGSIWDLRSRYRDEHLRGPLPEAALTIGVAVCSAERHHSRPAASPAE